MNAIPVAGRTLTVCVALLFVLCPFAALATEPYSEWLAAINRPGQLFLKGANQNGFYIAVLQRGSRHVAVCVFDLKPELSRNVFETTIADANGERVFDPRSVTSLRRTFRKETRGVVVQYAIIDGKEYRLVESAPRSIRITFSCKQIEGSDEWSVVFDEQVNLLDAVSE